MPSPRNTSRIGPSSAAVPCSARSPTIRHSSGLGVCARMLAVTRAKNSGHFALEKCASFISMNVKSSPCPLPPKRAQPGHKPSASAAAAEFRIHSRRDERRGVMTFMNFAKLEARCSPHIQQPRPALNPQLSTLSFI